MRLNISVLDSIVPLLTYHRPLKFNLPPFPKLVQPERREPDGMFLMGTWLLQVRCSVILWRRRRRRRTRSLWRSFL